MRASDELALQWGRGGMKSDHRCVEIGSGLGVNR
jgi:hypothetical protein